VADNGNLLHGNPETQFESGRTAVESGRLGGIASGKAKREKKAMKDTLATLLSMPLKDGMADDIEEIQSIASLNGKNITVQEAIMLAQIKKAVKGDTRAAEFVRDSSGNKPKEGVEISGDINNPLAGLSTEELKKLIVDD
jgi:hypothetical protein